MADNKRAYGNKNQGEGQNQDNKREQEEHQDKRIEQTGQLTLNENKEKQNIHLISIIGEIEGHDNLSGNSKTTKYEHILPQLAAIEDSSEIQGVLVLLNTMGGDVEAGLAIAEMLKQAYCVIGAWGKSFHRRSHCGKHRLFLYCTYRNHGDSPGKNQRHGNRSGTDL